MGGRKPDGVGTYPARPEQLLLYEVAAQQLAQMQTPVLYRESSTHAYFFVAHLDGSGQDIANLHAPASNVGVFHKQFEQIEATAGSRIAAGYVAGPGTQSNPLMRAADSAVGFSWNEKIEQAYRQLATQAQLWKAKDPDAQISVASIGYSRGAVEVPGLTRLIDHYGIADPGDLRFGRDATGNITVQSHLSPLVAAHQTAQAVVLIDPVGTGIPASYDRRLPPSVISGVTLLAADERRAAFPHTPIIHQGLSADGRFLGLTVPGAHSDAGGGNHRNGLEILAGNLLTDYINALSDTPLLHKRPLAAPEDTVVHRSEQALGGLFELGSSHAGAPRYQHPQLCVVVDPCRDSEPRDEALAGRFETQHPRNAPVPEVAHTADDARVQGPTAQVLPMQQPLLLDDAAHPQHPLYQQALAGISELDARAGRAPDVGSRQLAGTLAARAHETGLQKISHVVLGEDRTRVFAVDTPDLDAPHRRLAYTDVAAGRAQGLQASTQQVEQAEQNRLPAAERPQQMHTQMQSQMHAAPVRVHAH